MPIRIKDRFEFDKLTEWCRNKPEEAAGMILSLQDELEGCSNYSDNEKVFKAAEALSK